MIIKRDKWTFETKEHTTKEVTLLEFAEELGEVKRRGYPLEYNEILPQCIATETNYIRIEWEIIG